MTLTATKTPYTLNNVRNWQIATLILSVLVIILLFRTCHAVRQAYVSQQSIDTTAAIALLTVEKDDSGRTQLTIAAKDAAVLIPKEKEAQIYQTISHFIDSATNDKSATISKTQEIPPAPAATIYIENPRNTRDSVQNDSLRKVIFNNNFFQNQFLTYNAPEKDSANNTKPATYSYNAKINAEQMSTISTFIGIGIGKKKSFVQLTSLDTNATINGLKVYRSNINEPRYGLRIQGILGYNFSTFSPTIGAAIRMDFGRFSISNSYPYNFKLRKATYALSLTGDIVRF